MQQPGASQSVVAPVSQDYYFLMLVGPGIVSAGLLPRSRLTTKADMSSGVACALAAAWA
jgi:hypothetical protein